MRANRTGTCPKCGEAIPVGADIKRWVKRIGYNPDTGKPDYLVTKEWVHVSCKAPRKPQEPLIDYETGEVLG
jgi:hypothetical protein